MEAASHLERMSKELKCPICLSLLNSAVSLTCNHIFCNCCIAKSMISDSTCPVCKIPFQRREIRLAPHMDTLVSIYKSMEVASGVNILVSQTAPPMSGKENQVADDMVCRSETTSKGCSGTPNQQNQRRKKGTTSKGSLKKPKSRNSKPMRPSFPAKKRVQVPQHPLQETPTKPANPECVRDDLIKDRTQKNVFVPEDRTHLNENGEKLFQPFFWLRDEENATEKTTQLTGGDPVNVSPPGALCFSDIKDSEDEGPCNVTSKDVDIFDSEMFEWTQKACSPELCSSPMKDKESNGYDNVLEKQHKGVSQYSAVNVICRTDNEGNMTRQRGTDDMDAILPTSSPPQTKKAIHEVGTKRSKKISEKAKKSIQKKRVKRATDEMIGLCTLPQKGAGQDKNSNTGELVIPKEPIHKGGKKVSVENDNNIIRQKETDNVEVILPTSSPSQIKRANQEAGTKRSKKSAEKARENIQKKRVKRATAEVVGVCMSAQRGADQDNISNTGELAIQKKQILKRGNKVSVDDKSPKASKTTIATAHDDGNTPYDRDGSTVCLLDSLDLREGSSKGRDSNSVGKNTEKITNQQNKDRARNLKTGYPSNSTENITESHKALISQFPREPSVVDGEIKLSTSGTQAKRGQASKDLKASKQVTFSMNESIKLKSADGLPGACKNVATKVRHLLSSSNVKVKKDSDPPAKTNTMFLPKWDTVSDIRCAFCQSPEESDLAGFMVHYLNGKPIMSDHEVAPRAIHAHRKCAEWAPNVYFEDDIAVNLEGELARSRRIKCCCCGLKGAVLGCYEKSCRKSFHFPCAKLTPKCRWDDDNFVMLCPLHASYKLPKETCDSQLDKKKKRLPQRQYDTKQSQAAVTNTASTSSRWDSHGLFTKIVLCCSALTSTEKETIVKFEKLSGVTILKTWDSRVTHVIASVDDNGACRRTLKYLMGILEGKWILTFEWIKACMEVKKPVDEQLYQINVDNHGVRGGPQLGRLRLLNKEPKLFNGYKFYFTGDFVASYRGYLHDLVIAAGGAILHRKPIQMDNEPQFSGHTNPLQFLIYSLELPDNCSPDKKNVILSCRKSDAEALAMSSGAVAVSNSWVLNSIASCKLQYID